MGSHNDLIAFRHALRMATTCRRIAATFPTREAELASQLRRAADSVALNIAEGNSRGSNRDFRRFLETARGSLKEVEVIVQLAGEGGLIAAETLALVSAQIEETGRTLYGLLRAINERLKRGEVDRMRRPGTAPLVPAAGDG